MNDSAVKELPIFRFEAYLLFLRKDAGYVR